MAKKNWLIGCGVAAAVVLVSTIGLGLYFWGTYNSLVTAKEDVSNKWSQVENQYQRRADLIPNLVNTVKGFAKQEKDIFTEVARLRSQWGEAKSSGDQAKEIEAAKGMDSALARLLVVAEAYPQLKSDQNFIALQAELAGTENRVAVERKRYNDQVTIYNKKIKVFPTSLLAGLFGFKEFAYFEAEAGADKAPKVEF